MLYVSVVVKVKKFKLSRKLYVFFLNTEICRRPTDHREVKHKGHENLCYL